MKQRLHLERSIRLLLRAILLFTVSSSLALALEPAFPASQADSPQGPLGMEALDLQLAQGQISDPLARGHNVFTWDKIVMAWEDDNESNFPSRPST